MTRLYLLLLAALLAVACRRSDVVAPTGDVVVTTDRFALRNPRDTATAAEQQRRFSAAQDYYLQHHDARDEGYDLVVATMQRRDSSVCTYLPRQSMSYYHNVGGWRCHVRQGRVVCRDARGRLVIAAWQADTVVCGVRFGSDGLYAGQMRGAMEAWGEGSCWSADGSYYTGPWRHDQREGFGLAFCPDMVRVGWWLRGTFRGERHVYHADRIYGIDISRYQHEHGRRRHPIDWSRLRVTHLGRRIGAEQVLGRVAYPVSFVYIKSTQGTDIVSRYYEDDYAAARHRGLVAGAYHFFSTHTAGADQARHYLANSRFLRGDLPPMLDLEPSPRQVELMGGAERLFDEARAWLHVVERATGCRPIIYCNQSFAKTYLQPYAPDLLRDYRLWVARYGEYKPDVPLSLWQSSCDARVEGIHGHVDLNVFDGDATQWQQFLSEAAIR